MVQVRATYQPPKIISRELELEVTRINTKSKQNINIKNPGDLPMYAQLLLGPQIDVDTVKDVIANQM